MLHLFCFLYHFQGIQPESGQKNEKSGITDSRTSQHLRADRMSGKEMKMPAKRQQPPLLHHSPKNGNSCHEKPNVNKKPCSKGIFCSYAAFPGIAFSRMKNHPAESDFPMSAELASDLYQKTEKRLLTVEKRCRKPCFPTYMEARERQKGKTKRKRKRPTERHIKKAMRKDMAYPLSKRKLQKQKAAFCQIPDTRESIIRDRSRPGLQIRHSRQPENDYLSFWKLCHKLPSGTGASTSISCLDTGWTKRTRRACRQMLPSRLLRGAPYFRSPLIGQPILANWQRI